MNESGSKRVRSKKKIASKSKIDLYGSNQQIQLKEVELKKLQDHRKQIENSISEIVNDYNLKSALSADASKFLERLPLESLHDLQNFSTGKKVISSLSILKSKSKLRKDRNKKLQDLSKINHQIVESQIDLLISKINHILKPNVES